METKNLPKSPSESPTEHADASELSDDQLDAVSGGDGKKKTTNTDQQDYLIVTMKDILISS